MKTILLSRPALITLFINLLFILFAIFGGSGGPCAPGAGIMIGLFIFAPLTFITFFVSGIFVFLTKHPIAKGIALAELITIAIISLFFLIDPYG